MGLVMIRRLVARASRCGFVAFIPALTAVAAHSQSLGRSARIPLSDSVSAVVFLDVKDPSVMVNTPRGRFRLSADTSMLASWARSAAQLPAPVPETGGPNAPLSLSGSVLRETGQSANAMRLLRLSADSVAAYRIDVTNGAWDYGEQMLPETAALLLAALSGRDAPGLNWVPDRPRTRAPDTSYHLAKLARGNPRPRYPSRARHDRLTGQVRTEFAIGTDGRARPETLLIVSASHPLFALAVRDALPEMRFVPATRGGLPIEDVVSQTFEFTFR